MATKYVNVVSGAAPEGQSVMDMAVVGGSLSSTPSAGSVTTEAIADGAVTAAKLAEGVTVSGPKGDKGDPGAAGPAGPKGATGATGAAGPQGVGVKSLALTTDATGKVTGGTLTLTDGKTAAVTVTVAGA